MKENYQEKEKNRKLSTGNLQKAKAIAKIVKSKKQHKNELKNIYTIYHNIKNNDRYLVYIYTK